ncbi:unnamed protein product [Acanthoscelides obtectus]|uniref:Deacetylase sirtuin-type domain-containing protein n=1 Tax=Acanthoscelides obtectus TaxID=200917 RepID=A0A9P0LKA0_ACAOB|nr:unnamed protein product [Acanthoscelides obtectus]CAK1663605.1 NAD-dependent protein deacylase Sirt4 [Acanthoscelides obtectus]
MLINPTMLEQLFCRKYSTDILKFVPKHKPALDRDVDVLKEFIQKSNKIAVLTGAGISTESGIPDYRSEEVGLYARTNHKPVQYMEFLKSAQVRRRYWARNYVGWYTFSQRQPNQVHYSIRNLEHVHNKVSSVITQNVDGLHFKAGSSNVIELHGTAFRVICLQCRAEYDRFYIQDNLRDMNPHMVEVINMIRPDGDVEIPQVKLVK